LIVRINTEQDQCEEAVPALVEAMVGEWPRGNQTFIMVEAVNDSIDHSVLFGGGRGVDVVAMVAGYAPAGGGASLD
jgi:hypothetical protein